MDLRFGLGAKRRDGGGSGRSLRSLLLEVLARYEPAARSRRDQLLETPLPRELGLGSGDALLLGAES
jgi:hypothetical protein